MDVEIFNRNFDYLLDVSGYKIDYIEELCKVHIGYFYKRRKDGKLPRIEVLLELSKIFNVTINTMISEEITCPSNISLVCEFIDKVCDDISHNKVHVRKFGDDDEYRYKLTYPNVKKALLINYPNSIDIFLDKDCATILALNEYPEIRSHMDKLWSKIKVFHANDCIGLTDDTISLIKDMMNT